jgi:hypothetical protein
VETSYWVTKAWPVGLQEFYHQIIEAARIFDAAGVPGLKESVDGSRITMCFRRRQGVIVPPLITIVGVIDPAEVMVPPRARKSARSIRHWLGIFRRSVEKILPSLFQKTGATSPLRCRM